MREGDAIAPLGPQETTRSTRGTGSLFQLRVAYALRLLSPPARNMLPYIDPDVANDIALFISSLFGAAFVAYLSHRMINRGG